MSSAQIGWVARRFSSLTTRLLAAFVAVAVGAVAIVAAVAVVAVDRRTGDLIAAQRTALRDQVGRVLAAAYASGRGTWTAEDLAALQATATANGLTITLTDAGGHHVATIGPEHSAEHASPSPVPTPSTTATAAPSAPRITSPGPAPTHHAEPGSGPHGSGSTPSPTHHDDGEAGVHDADYAGAAAWVVVAAVRAGVPPAAARTITDPTAGDVLTVPIVVDGTEVGSAQLVLPTGFDDPLLQARDALLLSVLLAAGLAVLLAVGAGVVVARRLSRPVADLTAATKAMTGGDPMPERGLRPGPGELGDLARAFSTMAATVRREDDLRRSLVADVAHELRTPVTILRGQTEQLLDGIEEPTTARLVSLHDEVLRLQRLTDDLATLSAADAAGVALHLAPVDLADLARRALTALTSMLDEAGVEAGCETDAAVWVSADEDRLMQVVLNLLTNAAKFTPAGGSVTVRVDRDGESAVLTVADTGPGIPAEDLPHLFERFWRGAGSSRRGGSGIGLAVVDTLVAVHDGTVSVASPESGGAVFEVRLPAAARDVVRSRP